MLTTTPQDIFEEVRIITDYVDSDFMTDQEMLIRLNAHRRTLYLEMYRKCDPTYFWNEAIVDIDDGKGDLPEDFFQAKSVEGKSGGSYFHLRPRSHTEAADYDNSTYEYGSWDDPPYYFFQPTQGIINVFPKGSVSEVRLRYVPVVEKIAALDEVINLVYHEDRYLVASLSVDIMTKDESDPSMYYQEKLQVLNEILRGYKPDASYPKKVVDKRNRYRGRFRWR